jgi:hypothetical protein
MTLDLGLKQKYDPFFIFYFIGDKTETSGNWDMLPSLGLRAPCASAEDLTCHEDSPASSGLATDDDDVRTHHMFSQILNNQFLVGFFENKKVLSRKNNSFIDILYFGS